MYGHIFALSRNSAYLIPLRTVLDDIADQHNTTAKLPTPLGSLADLSKRWKEGGDEMRASAYAAEVLTTDALVASSQDPLLEFVKRNRRYSESLTELLKLHGSQTVTRLSRLDRLGVLAMLHELSDCLPHQQIVDMWEGVAKELLDPTQALPLPPINIEPAQPFSLHKPNDAMTQKSSVPPGPSSSKLPQSKGWSLGESPAESPRDLVVQTTWNTYNMPNNAEPHSSIEKPDHVPSQAPWADLVPVPGRALDSFSSCADLLPLMVPRNPRSIISFLVRELDLDRLEERCHWLDFAEIGRPRHATLHAQINQGRKIVLCERLDMHLLVNGKLIFMKPVPGYLLSASFWKQYMIRSSSQIPWTTETTNSRAKIYVAALGLLTSYLDLVNYEHEYQIALQHNLIPEDVSWSDFQEIMQALMEFIVHQPRIFALAESRFLYHELSLQRLQLIPLLSNIPWLSKIYSKKHLKNHEWKKMHRGRNLVLRQYGTFPQRKFPFFRQGPRRDERSYMTHPEWW